MMAPPSASPPAGPPAPGGRWAGIADAFSNRIRTRFPTNSSIIKPRLQAATEAKPSTPMPIPIPTPIRHYPKTPIRPHAAAPPRRLTPAAKLPFMVT